MADLPAWASHNIEPKRKFKFIMSIGGIPAWVVKSAGRPTLQVSDGAKHQFIAHEFKFPGRVTWNDIEVSLVDPIDPDVSKQVLDIIGEAGYINPDDWDPDKEDWKKTLSKKNFMVGNGSLGDVSIQSLDSDGKTVESWILRNAWIKQVGYDDVDYSGEELLYIKLTIVYDFAVLKKGA